MRVKTIIFTFCLLFPASSLWINAQDLILGTEDICVENHGDPGLHLFIRKKPDIGSVMLTESTKDPTGMEDTLAYRAPEWNPINGDELRVSSQDASWPLLDSSPEHHPLLGEAFHIYIPPLIVYGTEGGRQGTVVIAEGAYINIRTFALPYADYAGGFEDNPFTLDYFPYPESPAFQQETDPVLPDPSPPPVVEEELPVSEEIATPETPEEEPAKPVEEYRPSPLPVSGKETFGFAPHVEARFGLRVFFPGPGGTLLTSLPLKNTYNPVGSVTLTQPINEGQSVVLEVERESFSLNRITARAVWDIGVVGIEAGPYMGVLNTDTWDISPGLSVALRLRLPRWNFSGFFRLDSALGREPSTPGDYTQSYVSAGLSYTFPWTKFTLGMVERGSTVLDNQQVLRIGRWMRYNLVAEFPPIPKPWGFCLELGVEQLQWNYKQPLVPLMYDGDITVYAGLETSYTFRPGFFTLIIGLEGPVYPFEYPAILRDLANPAAPFYGRVTVGFRLTPQQ